MHPHNETVLARIDRVEEYRDARGNLYLDSHPCVKAVLGAWRKVAEMDDPAGFPANAIFVHPDTAAMLYRELMDEATPKHPLMGTIEVVVSHAFPTGRVIPGHTPGGRRIYHHCAAEVVNPG